VRLDWGPQLLLQLLLEEEQRPLSWLFSSKISRNLINMLSSYPTDLLIRFLH
jgi:hypothetical protein